MLVLTRRRDEQIVLGGGLARVHVVGINGSVVRLGIDAPASMEVHRREVYDAIANEGDRRQPSLARECRAEIVSIERVGGPHADETPRLILDLPSDRALRQVLADGFVQFTSSITTR